LLLRLPVLRAGVTDGGPAVMNAGLGRPTLALARDRACSAPGGGNRAARRSGRRMVGRSLCHSEEGFSPTRNPGALGTLPVALAAPRDPSLRSPALPQAGG